MKIWIDIGHIAQLNFYRNTIKTLAESDQVLVTVINRGKLPIIAKKELAGIKNCSLFVVGRHKGTKYSTIVDANFLRLIKLYRFYFKHKPKIAVGNSFLHGIIAKTFGVPALMFGDDIGRKFVILLMTTFSDEMYYVKGSLKNKNYKRIKTYNALKEWSYLSPRYFDPRSEVLAPYGLKENEYIFVREVITGTLNYHSQESNLIASVAKNFPETHKVLFSLEDKNSRDQYPDDWILLQEPIEDIHSLIYYSAALVSSGDSMAREGAMLGVPSIYCGVRQMNANDVMIELGTLVHKSPDEVPQYLAELVESSSIERKVHFRTELSKDWDDVTNLIVNKIRKYKK